MQAWLQQVSLSVCLESSISPRTVLPQQSERMPGVVTCISDGSQSVVEHLPGKNVRKRKRAGQPRRDKGPAGWVCVKFDDGFEDWFLMNSDSLNNAAMRSWRLDLDFVRDDGEPAEE